MAEITPVTEWPDYATNPQGGDPLTQDLNAPYDKVSSQCLKIRPYEETDMFRVICVWLLVCTILCW